MSLRRRRSRSLDLIVTLLLRIVPATLVMGTIFLLSHQSGDNLSLPLFPGADKIAHLFAYGTLALAVLWGRAQEGVENPRRIALQTVIFCFCYGMSDEFHQSFIPYRSVSGLDLLADTAGALWMTLVWLGSLSLRRKMINFQQRLVMRFTPPFTN